MKIMAGATMVIGDEEGWLTKALKGPKNTTQEKFPTRHEEERERESEPKTTHSKSTRRENRSLREAKHD